MMSEVFTNPILDLHLLICRPSVEEFAQALGFHSVYVSSILKGRKSVGSRAWRTLETIGISPLPEPNEDVIFHKVLSVVRTILPQKPASFRISSGARFGVFLSHLSSTPTCTQVLFFPFSVGLVDTHQEEKVADISSIEGFFIFHSTEVFAVVSDIISFEFGLETLEQIPYITEEEEKEIVKCSPEENTLCFMLKDILDDWDIPSDIQETLAIVVAPLTFFRFFLSSESIVSTFSTFLKQNLLHLGGISPPPPGMVDFLSALAKGTAEVIEAFIDSHIDSHLKKEEGEGKES